MGEEVIEYRCNYPVNLNKTIRESGIKVYLDENEQWRCGEKFSTHEKTLQHIVDFHNLGSRISEIGDDDKTRYF